MKKADVDAENLSMSRETVINCWHCHCEISLQGLFCDECRKIQKPYEGNSFALLGQDPEFTQDVQALEKSYFHRQVRVHPDLFMNASERERLYATQQASRLNEALQILKDPLRRAEHLLEINGIPVPIPEKETSQDLDVLMEMMDLQESLESDSHQEKTHQQVISQKIHMALGDLSRAFECKDFTLAQKHLHRLKYLKRLQGGQ